jgi:hypothetical protein
VDAVLMTIRRGRGEILEERRKNQLNVFIIWVLRVLQKSLYLSFCVVAFYLV